MVFFLVCFFINYAKKDMFLVVLAFLLVCFFVISVKEHMFFVVVFC